MFEIRLSTDSIRVRCRDRATTLPVVGSASRTRVGACPVFKGITPGWTTDSFENSLRKVSSVAICSLIPERKRESECVCVKYVYYIYIYKRCWWLYYVKKKKGKKSVISFNVLRCVQTDISYILYIYRSSVFTDGFSEVCGACVPSPRGEINMAVSRGRNFSPSYFLSS